jgi:hypothetical protein
LSYTAIESGEEQTQKLEWVPLHAVFFLQSPALCRALTGLFVAMMAAGHRVLVALDPTPSGLPDDDVAFLNALCEQHPKFSYRVVHSQLSLWRIPANATRRSLDYIRYLSRDCAKTDPRREEARRCAPRAMRALFVLPPFRWTFGRRFVAWVLGRLEAGMPIPRGVRGFVVEQAPDLVLVSPLVELGSNQGDYLRAAAEAGIPSIFIVGGDDDLSAKGAIRDIPTLTVTWSERQADEAVRLQGLPDDRVVVVEAADAGNAPAPPETLALVERTAPEETVRRSRGRILRPFLLLLTPLLAVVLPIFRPRRTARTAVRIIRQMPGRRRRRRAARARRRDRERKARVDADRRARAQARDQKRASVDASRAEKAQRAAAKEQGRAQTEGIKHDKLARARQKEEEAKLKRAETKHRTTASDEPDSPRKVGPATGRSELEGERERDLGQGAPASREGADARGQGGEGTDARGQGAEGTGAEGSG